MGFKNDYKIGKIGEQTLTNLLESLGFTTELSPDSQRSEYDIIARKENVKITFEVKFDAYSAISGNLALETNNPVSNKPSGITVSKADIWCEVLPDQYGHKSIWICSLKRLKSFIDKNPPFKHLTKVGDGNADIMLYKMDFLLTIFTRIDNLPKDNIEKVLKKIKKEK